MKKFILASSLSMLLCGCSPSQWQSFQSDPAAYIATYEQSVQVFLAIAGGVFQALSPLLPKDQQAAAQQKYTLAVDAVTHAELALNEALKVAADAKQNPINVASLLADVTNAVAALEQVILDIKSIAPANAKMAASASSSDLSRAYKVVASFH